MERDGGCVAPHLDPPSGPCYDKWGVELEAWQPARLRDLALEADYVRLNARGKRHQYAADHATVCAGHHRSAGPNAGYQWATANRPLLREYLDTVSKPEGPPRPCPHCSDTVAWHAKNGWVDAYTWEPHTDRQAADA